LNIPKLLFLTTVVLPFIQDSFLLKWFKDMKDYLHVGPPVYFVLNDGYDYEHPKGQNMICGSAGCKADSLVQQIYVASLLPEE